MNDSFSVKIMLMQPNNPQGPSDPFAFINNAAPVGKKPKTIAPSTTRGTIILVGSLLGVLLLLFVVVMSFLNNASQEKAKKYLELGQKQTEIIRLSAIGEQKAKSLETRSYAASVKLSMTTSQSNVNKIITANGVSSKQLSKELTKSKNPQSDTILDEAEKNSRFDETFKELLVSEITKYQQQINTVAGGSSGTERTILQDAFNQASTLQGPPPKTT